MMKSTLWSMDRVQTILFMVADEEMQLELGIGWLHIHPI